MEQLGEQTGLSIRQLLWLFHRYLTVRAVSNGQEAVDAAETGMTDIEILDVCMPVIDGVEQAVLKMLGSR